MDIKASSASAGDKKILSDFLSPYAGKSLEEKTKHLQEAAKLCHDQAGQPCYSGPLNGKFDAATQTALAHFKDDRRDAAAQEVGTAENQRYYEAAAFAPPNTLVAAAPAGAPAVNSKFTTSAPPAATPLDPGTAGKEAWFSKVMSEPGLVPPAGYRTEHVSCEKMPDGKVFVTLKAHVDDAVEGAEGGFAWPVEYPEVPLGLFDPKSFTGKESIEREMNKRDATNYADQAEANDGTPSGEHRCADGYQRNVPRHLR